MQKIIRVFPRRTNATPTDEMAFIGDPPLPGFQPPADEIHISVTFTYDLREAERLWQAWNDYYPGIVRIGGPAFNEPGGEFTPGRYIGEGYIITSRGCPNRCWFCSVWKRENGLKELTIKEGWNLLDDNILACSDQHIKAVFEMLGRQTGKDVTLTGGLEAKRLKKWHIEMLKKVVKPKRVFFACDTKDDYEPLQMAASMLAEQEMLAFDRCHVYCLIGFPGDRPEDAEERLNQILELNMCPMAMLWRDDAGETTMAWRKFQKEWARPAIVRTKYKALKGADLDNA